MITHKHTRRLARGHLIKGEQQSEEDNLRLRGDVAAYFTPPRALNHTVSRSAPLQESNMDAFPLQSSSHLPPPSALISGVWSRSMLITP